MREIENNKKIFLKLKLKVEGRFPPSALKGPKRPLGGVAASQYTIVTICLSLCAMNVLANH